MVVKKMESYARGFFICNTEPLSPPPLPPSHTHSKTLYLRHLKNNQNQMNTTGAQNLKEFNNTAERLSGFL
jgi:hypothetical protein